jgi:hypothetical protein
VEGRPLFQHSTLDSRLSTLNSLTLSTLGSVVHQPPQP